MVKPMSLQMRREFLISARYQYQQSEGLDKRKILDSFLAASGYDRKYAIRLLNSSNEIIKLPQHSPHQHCHHLSALIVSAMLKG